MKRPRIFIMFLFLTGYLFYGFHAVAYASEELQDAVNLSSDYLLHAVQDDGKFIYRINMDKKVVVKKKYNILRHAGSIYAMTMQYDKQPSPELRNAILKAGSYIRDVAIGPVAENESLLAVWSDPQVNNGSGPMQVKLGGTGLGLLALLQIEHVEPGFTQLGDLQSLARFIVYMQKEDGSFYSKFIPSEGGKTDKWVSLYYPGEAALALVAQYEKDGSKEWVLAAAKALSYLARQSIQKRSVLDDHWALLASKRLFDLGDIFEKNIVDRELLTQHVVSICDHMIKGQVNGIGNVSLNGGFAIDGRVTPTAIRLEGLQAAYSCVPADSEIKGRILLAVENGIDFLMRAQIQKGEFKGGFPRSIARKPFSANAAAFNNRVGEIRIDYVQHALSALLQYIELKGVER
ncbi:MAG: hypothetical protein HRU15_12045 [Planctomycetes bacterium]|nr:hypothetical protein [Planctomycetota bacterium]